MVIDVKAIHTERVKLQILQSCVEDQCQRTDQDKVDGPTQSSRVVQALETSHETEDDTNRPYTQTVSDLKLATEPTFQS